MSEHLSTNRIIGEIRGEANGPTTLFIGALHGNEPSGPAALQQLFQMLAPLKSQLKGTIIGILGNKAAYETEQRYLSADLNRLWTPHNIKQCQTGTFDKKNCAEYAEMADILHEVDRITAQATGKIYCIDLHSTSAPTLPFAPLNDQIRNREFVEHFPIPVILGIEEFISGTLLSYFNEREIIAVGFEAGQHLDPETQSLHYDFCQLALTITGNISAKDLAESDIARQRLEVKGGGAAFYDIRYLYKITPGENFKMLPGFKSFQKIAQKQHLADNEHGPISSPYSGTIFMPLYQSLGSEGFFLIQNISKFWLWCSKWARQLRLEWLLIMLPGVRRHPEHAHTLCVNRHVARILATQIFHLLGYRRRWQDDANWIFTRREL